MRGGITMQYVRPDLRNPPQIDAGASVVRVEPQEPQYGADAAVALPADCPPGRSIALIPPSDGEFVLQGGSVNGRQPQPQRILGPVRRARVPSVQGGAFGSGAVLTQTTLSGHVAKAVVERSVSEEVLRLPEGASAAALQGAPDPDADPPTDLLEADGHSVWVRSRLGSGELLVHPADSSRAEPLAAGTAVEHAAREGEVCAGSETVTQTLLLDSRVEGAAGRGIESVDGNASVVPGGVVASVGPVPTRLGEALAAAVRNVSAPAGAPALPLPLDLNDGDLTWLLQQPKLRVARLADSPLAAEEEALAASVAQALNDEYETALEVEFVDVGVGGAYASLADAVRNGTADLALGGAPDLRLPSPLDAALSPAYARVALGAAVAADQDPVTAVHDLNAESLRVGVVRDTAAESLCEALLAGPTSSSLQRFATFDDLAAALAQGDVGAAVAPVQHLRDDPMLGGVFELPPEQWSYPAVALLPTQNSVFAATVLRAPGQAPLPPTSTGKPLRFANGEAFGARLLGVLPHVQRAEVRANARVLPGYVWDAQDRPLEAECLQQRSVTVRPVVPEDAFPDFGLLRPKLGWLHPEDAGLVTAAERLPSSGGAWRLACLGGRYREGATLLLSSPDATAEVVVASVSEPLPPAAAATRTLRTTAEGVRGGSVNDGDALTVRGSRAGVVRGAARVSGEGEAKEIEAVLLRPLKAGDVVAAGAAAEFTLAEDAAQGSLVVTSTHLRHSRAVMRTTTEGGDTAELRARDAIFQDARAVGDLLADSVKTTHLVVEQASPHVVEAGAPLTGAGEWGRSETAEVVGAPEPLPPSQQAVVHLTCLGGQRWVAQGTMADGRRRRTPYFD